MRIGERTQEESPALVLFLFFASVAGLLFATIWPMHFFAENLANLLNGSRATSARKIVSVTLEGFVVLWFGAMTVYMVLQAKWLKIAQSKNGRC